MVLRYVREALLGREGGNLAKITEGFLPQSADLEGIRAFVIEVVRGLEKAKDDECAVVTVTKDDEPVYGNATVAMLEEIVLPELTKVQGEVDLKTVSETIFAKIADMNNLADHKAAKDTYVQMVDARRGTICNHILWAGNILRCGRTYHPTTQESTDRKGQKPGWCKTCLASVAANKPVVSGKRSRTTCLAGSVPSGAQASSSEVRA